MKKNSSIALIIVAVIVVAIIAFNNKPSPKTPEEAPRAQSVAPIMPTETRADVIPPSPPPPAEPEAKPEVTSQIHQDLNEAGKVQDDGRLWTTLQSKAKVSDFTKLLDEAKEATSLEDPRLQAIRGQFTGSLPPSDYNDEPWVIHTRLDLNGSEAEYELTADGRKVGRIERTAGAGAARAFRFLPDDGGIILEVGPKRFIHAFYVAGSEMLAGNFYTIEDSGRTDYHGPIILLKQ